MALFPAMLDLRNRPVLVVGGGKIASRKAAALVAAGAKVTCIAPQVADEMRALGVTVHQRPYAAGEAADGYWLVTVATNDPAVQRLVFADGEQHRVWVNAADDPSNCSFILPAVHREGPVVVAVSTSGVAPALASWLRNRVIDALPADVVGLSAALAAERAKVHDAGESTETVDWPPIIERLVRERE